MTPTAPQTASPTLQDPPQHGTPVPALWSALAPRTLVIIPTAGRVPAELVPFTQSRHSAMIRLHRKPVIYWTMEYLLKVGFKQVAFAVDRRNNVVQSFVEHLAGWRSNLYFAQPDRDQGVAYSIACALTEAERQGAEFDHVLVVLGDTYFQLPQHEPERLESLILTSPFDPASARSSDWCLVQADAMRQVQGFLNKADSVTESGWEIVTGVYFFRDAELLRRSLQPGELHHVLSRYAEQDPIRCLTAGQWWDCGHLDNLLQAEEKMVKERAFNQIELDRLRGVIRKTSSNVSKLQDEIAYYQQLPPQLCCLFPRLLSADPAQPSMELEFYGYPSLSDTLVFDSVHPSLWQLILTRLRALVDLFAAQPAPVWDEQKLQSLTYAMYVEKTHERLEELTTQDELWPRLLTPSELRVNGRMLRNLPQLLPLLSAECARLARTEDFSVIHGDLCFANILYDIPTGTCRLIDPRGSFGEPGIYGDLKYDVAKLAHSVDGSYDFIINDLFHVGWTDESVDFRVFNHNSEVKHAFNRVFFGDGRFVQREVELLQGLLFLSMIPLHIESLQRQVAMFGTALEKLNSVFDGSEP